MSGKKEEERNEKIIRGLMKLPPNRKCINCTSLGPQYVCTNFWTFICIACSGIHREFTHRVKSVSMAKFTKQEVEALQRGGNQRAREIFLKDWDMQRMRLPDSSNPDKIREFIRSVYVEKKYAGGQSSDKPPRDTQSLKNYEEDQRRASSYHSYSQSPPYEHQYEERRYGKQSGVLTRRPGSDCGLYEGKISSFIYSPGHLQEHMYEDRFANESTGSRISDYSVSSTGDPFRFDGPSTNLQESGYSSPPSQQVRDILVQDARPHTLNAHSKASIKENVDGIPRSHRTASSGSFGSFDSNSVSLKSVNSGSLVDIIHESEQPSRTQQAEILTCLTQSEPFISPDSMNHDFFSPPFEKLPTTTSAHSIDLFANVNHQPLSTTPEQKLPSIPKLENEGWATFDLLQNVGHASEKNDGIASMLDIMDGGHKESKDEFSSMHNNSQWFAIQSSAAAGPYPPVANQWHVGMHDVKMAAGQKAQNDLWDAFDDFSAGTIPPNLLGSLPFNSGSQGPAQKPPMFGDNAALKVLEDSYVDGFLKSSVDNRVPASNVPFNVMEVAVRERKSTNPFDLPFDSDLEANNAFLDMNSLQAALPNALLPSVFSGGLPQPWFPESSVNAYVPSVPQGLAFIGGPTPNPQLPNVPPQGPVTSLGGNPIA